MTLKQILEKRHHENARKHGLQGLDPTLYGKYMPMFKARLVKAVSDEVIKIDKDYGVILDAHPNFMDECYLAIYFSIDQKRNREP